MGIYDGHTSTLAGDGANSGWSPELVDIMLPSKVAEQIDTSHLGTSGSRTKISGNLTNVEDITVTINTDPSDVPVFPAVNESWTITFPLLAGETTAAKLVFSGHVLNYSPGSLASNAKMEGSVTLGVSGDWTYTAAVPAD